MVTTITSNELMNECSLLLLAEKGGIYTYDIDVYSTPDLHFQAEVQVEPLRYAEVPRAVDIGHKAMANDSLQRYLTGAFTSPTRRRLHTVIQKFASGTHFCSSVRHHRALTVDHGDAALTYTEPGEKTRGPLILWVAALVKKLEPAEYQKRSQEVGDAIRAMYKAVFNDSTEHMFEITGLATAPEKQGRGYGSALVAVVHDKADVRGAATFLLTSDAKGFYEVVGYKMVAETIIGLDNPKWTGGPVALRVMLRESPSVTGAYTEKMTVLIGGGAAP